MNILIRPAKIEDAKEIVEAERAIAEEPGYFCSAPSELAEENVKSTITAFNDGSGLYLVAESTGSLVGHAFLEPNRLHSLRHVADLNIAVHLGWQKKGIGTQLLKQIIDWAKKSDVLKKIQLNVRASNSRAISLYRKMGFKEEGRLKNRVKIRDGYVDDITMGLDLSKDMLFSKNVLIRELKKEDLDPLVKTFCFPWSSIEATREKWTRYYDEQLKKIRTVYLLEKEGHLIGYASLLHHSGYPHFKNAGIPEIHDVWITKEWRNQGFGTMLIQSIEYKAQLQGHQQIGLGVGLYADYGTAQQLYFHLGYVPDGYGVSYNYQPTIPGEPYPLDDDLVLWLKKNL